jgi:hypothetical protein
MFLLQVEGYKLSEPTGSEWRQSSDKITSLYVDSHFQITVLLKVFAGILTFKQKNNFVFNFSTPCI